MIVKYKLVIRFKLEYIFRGNLNSWLMILELSDNLNIEKENKIKR
jgi:hypothetical protein